MVLTLRGDFYGHALAHRALADRLQNAVLNLGPMTRDELRDVVTVPANKVGLKFQPGLVDAILDDVGSEPGNLPLLEFVLTQLWEQRRNSTLTHDVYGEMGGLKGAIGKRADDVLKGLGPDQREIARRVFVQLVHPGKDTEDTRRRARLGELGQAALPVVWELADARLVVTGKPEPLLAEIGDDHPPESTSADQQGAEETVEVAHEALIRNWNTLRDWMKEDRAFRLWQEDFQTPFRRWRRNQRDEGALLRGGQLAEAERWRGERADALTAEEIKFIDEGIRLRKRTEWRRKVAVAASLLVAAVMAGVGTYAWYASNEAERNAALAEQQAKRATAETERAEAALRASQAEYLGPARSGLV